MLYLLSQLGDQIPALNVFRYITFRTGGATVTAIIFVFLFGPTIISALRIRQGKGQPIRDDGPKSHLVTKVGHADHGRADDPFGATGLDAAVGQPLQRLCLDRAPRHPRLRPDRAL